MKILQSVLHFGSFINIYENIPNPQLACKSGFMPKFDGQPPFEMVDTYATSLAQMFALVVNTIEEKYQLDFEEKLKTTFLEKLYQKEELLFKSFPTPEDLSEV